MKLGALFDHLGDSVKFQLLLIILLERFPTQKTTVLRNVHELVMRLLDTFRMLGHQVPATQIHQYLLNGLTLGTLVAFSFSGQGRGTLASTLVLLTHLHQRATQQLANFSHSFDSLRWYFGHAGCSVAGEEHRPKRLKSKQ